MAENYDDKKFNLVEDWYWPKVIGKRDELLYMQIQDDMREVLLDYHLNHLYSLELMTLYIPYDFLLV